MREEYIKLPIINNLLICSNSKLNKNTFDVELFLAFVVVVLPCFLLLGFIRKQLALFTRRIKRENFCFGFA